MSQSADDPNGLAWISAFAQGLQERGWTIGSNVRVEYRWGAGDLDRFRKYAAELVALSPDVIVATVTVVELMSVMAGLAFCYRDCGWRSVRNSVRNRTLISRQRQASGSTTQVILS